MRMAPSEFDTLVYKANKFVKIGNIVFENIDTMLYHGVVHNIIFKGKFYQNYIMNTDEMARCVRSGMDSYSDVIQSLSSKYFRRRATNASAEAFNSKVKIFRSQMRGVRDRDFFIFRLVKLYA